MLWPSILPHMKIHVKAVDGSVQELIGHTIVLLVRVIFHLMNQQFGIVTLACTISPDLTPVTLVCLVGVDGDKEHSTQNPLMMTEVQVGLLGTQGLQLWKTLLQRREAH